MKLSTYYKGEEHLGIFVNNKLYQVNSLHPDLPNDILNFLALGEKGMTLLKSCEEKLMKNADSFHSVEDYQLLAPVPRPTSCRDGYAFRQHVATARRNRGLGMIPEFDQYPIFYFTNHNAIFGPGEISLYARSFSSTRFRTGGSRGDRKSGTQHPCGRGRRVHRRIHHHERYECPYPPNGGDAPEPGTRQG